MPTFARYSRRPAGDTGSPGISRFCFLFRARAPSLFQNLARWHELGFGGLHNGVSLALGPNDSPPLPSPLTSDLR